jgi:hypothetical protein
LVLAGAGAIMLLSGCTGKTFKQFDVSSPNAQSVSVDATQRFLLVKRMPVDGSPGVVVCAEPSPDAAMAVAAELAASGTLPNAVQVALTGGKSESLASLGLRTPAIQLVRDIWYRACEGYMNGVHKKPFLNAAARKMDKLIVTLAAIDGITSAPAASAVAIGQMINGEAATEATRGADGSLTGKGSAKAATSSLTVIVEPGAARPPVDGAAAAVQAIVKDYLASSERGDQQLTQATTLTERQRP